MVKEPLAGRPPVVFACARKASGTRRTSRLAGRVGGELGVSLRRGEFMRIRWSRVGAVLLLSTPLAFLGSGCPTPSPCTVNPTPEIDPMIAVATTPQLQGWVDLHTHPISNLGFAGKLVYGGVDSQADGGA